MAKHLHSSFIPASSIKFGCLLTVYQLGSKGIRQWPINLFTSPMINKITPFVDCNYCLKRLDTQLNEPTNQNLIKFPKVVKLTKKDFGDQCNKQPNVPFLPGILVCCVRVYIFYRKLLILNSIEPSILFLYTSFQFSFHFPVKFNSSLWIRTYNK